MADYIFTSGTAAKSGMYQKILDLFLAAGWTNISSNPATDYDVLRSTGEAGDKQLIIQLRPLNLSGANSTITTDYSQCSYRLVESYTPGASGVAGTFGKAAEGWNSITLIPVANTTTHSKDTLLTYWVHVNKNRMIISIESPSSVAKAPVVHYIGIPDVTNASEPGSRGLLVGNSSLAKTAANLHITNAVGELPSDAASSTRTIYCQLAPKNPNSAGLYTFSEALYGSTAEGIRGKISGMFFLPNGGINQGDTITIGTKKYRVVVAESSGNNSFPSLTFAFQIA